MLTISYMYNLLSTDLSIAIKTNKMRLIAISFYTYLNFVEKYVIKLIYMKRNLQSSIRF